MDCASSSSLRLAAAAALALLAACETSKAGPSMGRADTGTGGMTLTCQTMADCNGMGICVGGVCESVTACSSDMECSASGGVCHSTRGFCVECDGRHANECPMGKTCQFDFTCVAIGGGGDGGVADAGASCSGMCSDRTMCGTDQVCRAGSCCPPPARCRTTDDCPANRPECNGATGECFGGDSCRMDSDCSTRMGCGGNACFCDTPGAGRPGTCKMRPDECANDEDCNPGRYMQKLCTLGAPAPRRCITAVNCTSDAQCTDPAGLVCDLTMGSPSYQRCKNGKPCPMGNECAATEVCQAQVCASKSCLNTPTLCMANETCDRATARCIPNQTTSCTSDMQCQLGQWCDTMVSLCKPGCRDNNECPGGICNATHACENPMGGYCGPCMSDMDCPMGTKCFTNPFTMTSQCKETCSMILMDPCTTNPMAVCIFGQCSCTLGM